MSDEVGFISVDSWSHESFVVPIEQFDFDKMDSPEDFIREQIARKKPITPIIQAWATQIAEHKQADTVRAVIELIQECENPKRRLDEIMLACGITLNEKRETMLSIARKYDVKKQAIHRCVKDVSDRLGLRKTRTMRGDDARRRMSEAYWARHGGKA